MCDERRHTAIQSIRDHSVFAPEAARQAVGGGCQGGWGAVTVGYKCHWSRHLASGRQWLGRGWAPWRGGGASLPFQSIPARTPWPCVMPPTLDVVGTTRQTSRRLGKTSHQECRRPAVGSGGDATGAEAALVTRGTTVLWPPQRTLPQTAGSRTPHPRPPMPIPHHPPHPTPSLRLRALVTPHRQG